MSCKLNKHRIIEWRNSCSCSTQTSLKYCPFASLKSGAQANNYSIGRNARDLTWSLNYPTPGEINQVAPLGNTSGLKINEWLANTNEINENEFIELVNFTKFPVNLSGVSLSDSTDMSDNYI